ncbi:vegetative cell wall protein gp1-like [Xenopus laevis]|uniref:Vegetative cell wall protein gp1-like n=2 Tax=Xenopus laevis TaxID=8355 RepID=A0A1L8FB72_XENLA|nr:vegetative cell wall protein gp1-like [Xenopus laevis]OCT68835.1 hypothetical protein XELAEV_18040140mg [Xenopus laevis]
MRSHYPYFLLLITISISVLPRATGSIVPGLTGKCPHALPGKICLGIVSRCASDRECKWGEKCCDNGCGKSCIKVRGDFPGGDFQQFPPHKPPVFPKPKATCPSHVMKFRCLGKIRDECQADTDCGWNEKCCDNGCEMVCTNGEEQGIPKEPPFKPPKLPKPEGILPTLKPLLPRPPKIPVLKPKPQPPIIDPPVPPFPFPIPEPKRPHFPPFWDPPAPEPQPPIKDPPVPPFPFPIPPEPERPRFPPFWDPQPEPYYPDQPEPIDVVKYIP